VQDRYAGDLGDYLKFGLLRWLVPLDSLASLRLGVVWYRTLDEAHNADGRHIAYLQPGHRSADRLRPPDPDLYRVRVASGKFWSDIAEQRLCAFGGRVLIAVTTVRTVCPCVVGVVAVAARMFSEEQLEQLRSFPDIGRDDLIRYFTLTQADMAFVDPGRGRGPADRLGLAVQLCTLRWLGLLTAPVGARIS
jgi:hypothetical protein